MRRRDFGLSTVAGPDAVELHTSVPLEGRDLMTMASFTVCEGETVPFSLPYHPSTRQPAFVPVLVKSGYETEAHAWQQWVHRATAGHPHQLQILYGVAGERWFPESEISWLEGYVSHPGRSHRSSPLVLVHGTVAAW